MPTHPKKYTTIEDILNDMTEEEIMSAINKMKPRKDPDMIRFDFSHFDVSCGAVYVAPHEIWNTVGIILPPGYFGPSPVWPNAINVSDLSITPHD